MSDTFEELRRDFERDCAAINGTDSWKEVRDRYLAREGGRITAAMKQLRTLPKEEKPLFGQKMNELRTFEIGRAHV